MMTSNPGYYVALVVTSLMAKPENGTPLKQLKLLCPDDTTVQLADSYNITKVTIRPLEFSAFMLEVFMVGFV